MKTSVFEMKQPSLNEKTSVVEQRNTNLPPEELPELEHQDTVIRQDSTKEKLE